MSKLFFQECQRISASRASSNQRPRQAANSPLLTSPLWTAAFPHNSEQQNLLTTQHLFPRPNIYTHTREINSKNCIYQYCLEKPATTAHFGVGKVLILPVLLSILSVLTQRNDKDKYPVAHPVCLPTTALLFGQRRVCHQAHC